MRDGDKVIQVYGTASKIIPSSEELVIMAKRSPSRSNALNWALAMLLKPPVRNFPVSHTGIAKSLRYISINYCHPFKVQELGVIAGLSKRGYIKAFQKHIGAQPAQLLRYLRIEHAKRLVAKKDLPVKEIAAQCGYRSANSFWVAFRQTTGVSLGRFKRQTRWAKRS